MRRPSINVRYWGKSGHQAIIGSNVWFPSSSGTDGRRMGLFPKMFGGFQRIDLTGFPPSLFVASLMKLPMVAAA